MTVMLYDGSFEGLLTAIFEVYERRLADVKICRNQHPIQSLFGETLVIDSDPERAVRVYNKLKEKTTPVAVNRFYKSFLSESAGVEDHLLAYIRYVLSSRAAVENDYGNADVLAIQQISRKVDREKHRMEAFVRFQLTKDNLYYGLIQPDYNVLPLVSGHFKERYADQRWLIYDVRRKYGLYYDLHTVTGVEIDFAVNCSDKQQLAVIHDEKEALYQQLWQQYFSNVNIAARKNMKLHIQHMPKRYWRYLVEKLPDQRPTDDSP